MKPRITILTAALLTGACTTPIDYQSGQEPELIIMNAFLRTDETEHTVWLSRGQLNDVNALPDATLDCYVNGTLTASGVLQDTERYTENYHTTACAFRFSAKLQPGDEVRLEAASGELHASATVTAPLPARLAAVDTVSMDSDRYMHVLACHLQLEDRVGEANWYRLCAVLDGKKQSISDTGETVRNESGRNAVSFEFSNDPILNDGYRTQDDDRALAESGVTLGTGIYNRFCSFRDQAFADRTAEVDIQIPTSSLHYWGTYNAQPLRAFITRQLTLRLLTLSEETFSYLAALNAGAPQGYSWSILTEPVHIPSNVQDGLGFVSLSSASSVTLRLPDVEVPAPTPEDDSDSPAGNPDLPKF